jgi:hypothetical protein
LAEAKVNQHRDVGAAQAAAPTERGSKSALDFGRKASVEPFLILFLVFLTRSEVMKRLALLTACILLGGVLVANAEVVSVTPVVTTGTTYDTVALYITSITGTDVPAGDYLTGLKGTFSLAGANSYFYLSSKSNWYTLDVNGGDFQSTDPATTSWFDFSSTMTSDPHVRSTGSGNLWQTFTQTFAVTGAAGGAFFLGPTDLTPGGDDPGVGDGTGFDNTLFAVLTVPHGANLAGVTLFDGIGNYALPTGNGAVTGKATQVVIVPEPSTIALLGCGLFGLLAYAWRKRK